MRALVPARSLFLLGAILLLGGCGYRSAYVARADGRARMGWYNGKLVAQLPPNGVQLCYRGPGPGSGGGMASPNPSPGWSWPGSSPGGSSSNPSGGRGVEWVPYVGPPVSGQARFVAEARGGGEASSGGAAVGVAVAILVIMPLVTGGLSLDAPGIDDRTAGSMDDVNRYNDTMRRGAVPCAAVGVR